MVKGGIEIFRKEQELAIVFFFFFFFGVGQEKGFIWLCKLETSHEVSKEPEGR
jgi:hypothetical protein